MGPIDPITNLTRLVTIRQIKLKQNPKSPQLIDLKTLQLRISARDDTPLYRQIKERDGNLCVYCGLPVMDLIYGDGHKLPRTRTLDHINPKINGGEYILGNLVSSCDLCNNLKGRMSFPSFVRTLPYERQEVIAQGPFGHLLESKKVPA